MQYRFQFKFGINHAQVMGQTFSHVNEPAPYNVRVHVLQKEIRKRNAKTPNKVILHTFQTILSFSKISARAGRRARICVCNARGSNVFPFLLVLD